MNTALNFYPNIREAVLSMAAANGVMHREGPDAEAVCEVAMQALEADGVVTEDVQCLEAWIGTLNDEQKSILIEGEEDELSVLVATSPLGVEGLPVAVLFNDIWEAMEVL